MEGQRNTQRIQVNPVQVAELRRITSCGMHAAKEALQKRDGILEFAIEYVDRAHLAAVMSEPARFPKWHKYQMEINAHYEGIRKGNK